MVKITKFAYISQMPSWRELSIYKDIEENLPFAITYLVLRVKRAIILVHKMITDFNWLLLFRNVMIEDFEIC